MATKAMNFKFEEKDVLELKHLAAVFNMTLTEVVKDALSDYIEKMKNDPFYKLTANIEEASEKESKEVLTAIESLSDDDLSITSSKTFKY